VMAPVLPIDRAAKWEEVSGSGSLHHRAFGVGDATGAGYAPLPVAPPGAPLPCCHTAHILRKASFFLFSIVMALMISGS